MDDTAEQDIRTVIEGLIEALQTGDASRLDSLLSDRPGCLHIGSDPIEWFSKAQVMAGSKETMSVENDQVRAEAGAVDVHVVGDVAWTEGRGRFVNSQGAARDFRMTWVFARDDGRWRAVQSHTSIGVPNQEMFRS